MKIYSKKKFAEGILLVLLGAAVLMLGATNHDLDAMDIIIMAVSLIYGLDAFRRSLSQKLSREIKLEELDERNRYIELKAKSKALDITELICLALMVVTAIAAKLTGYEGFTGILLGLTIAFGVAAYTRIFAVIYYRDHI